MEEKDKQLSARAHEPERPSRRLSDPTLSRASLAYSMVLCGNVDGYRGKIEKVRFGTKIEDAFPKEIPATLLVLLLKVNKEGPSKKDIWRAPGNHAQIRTLARHMRDGTLVNISHFDEKTVASVIKLFLSKIPGGIFGYENEKRLFENFPRANAEDQRQLFCRIVCSLCLPSQHLLVLLFGTFHMVSEASDSGSARMTPDALGISVAPSLFHSCIHMREAKMEDVLRSKIASEVISKVIQNFGHVSLFPKTSYEFYARMTGRTMRVDENAVKLLFTLPNNTHESPVTPTTPFSIMAAKCAGSYSLSAVSGLEKMKCYDEAFNFTKEMEALRRTSRPSNTLPKITGISTVSELQLRSRKINRFASVTFGKKSTPENVVETGADSLYEQCLQHCKEDKAFFSKKMTASDYGLEFISDSGL